MVPSQGLALIHRRVQRNWQSLENTCKSPPSGSTAPSGGFAAHCSPSSSQPVHVNPVSNLHADAHGKAHTGTALPCACCSTRAATRRDSLSAALHQTGLSRWWCALLHPPAGKTFLLSGTECLESRYLLLFARGCWQRYHWRAVIYHRRIYLHLCLKKSGNLPDLKVLNQIW